MPCDHNLIDSSLHGGFGPGDRRSNPPFLARGPWLRAPSSAGVLAATVRVGKKISYTWERIHSVGDQDSLLVQL